MTNIEIDRAVIEWWDGERVRTKSKWELVGLRDFTIAFRRILL